MRGSCPAPVAGLSSHAAPFRPPFGPLQWPPWPSRKRSRRTAPRSQTRCSSATSASSSASSSRSRYRSGRLPTPPLPFAHALPLPAQTKPDADGAPTLELDAPALAVAAAVGSSARTSTEAAKCPLMRAAVQVGLAGGGRGGTCPSSRTLRAFTLPILGCHPNSDPQDAITKANALAVSNAARVQRWEALENDFRCAQRCTRRLWPSNAALHLPAPAASRAES